MQPLKRSLLLVWITAVSTASLAATRLNEPDPDFNQWMSSEPGQKASLTQMKQQCDKVLAADKNLDCSVSVLARMFETKAANQLPEYYLSIKRRHAQAIANDPERHE